MSKEVIFLTVLEAYRKAQKELILSGKTKASEKQNLLDMLEALCSQFERQWKEAED